LLDHKGDENPDDEFLILDDLNWLEGAIFRFKKNLLSSLPKPLHGEFPFKQCNDILMVLEFERTIYDQNVTAGNSRILHGFTLDTNKEVRSRIGQQMLVQINQALHVVIRRRGDASQHLC
jgi:hypothetical protein